MINCPACGLRHRAANSQCHRLGEVKYAVEAPAKHFRPQANPYWRAKPGKLFWVPVANKFMTLTQTGQKIWDSTKHKLVQVEVTPQEGNTDEHEGHDHEAA